MDIGCALMGGSLMPEVKAGAPAQDSAYDRLTTGYRDALAMGYDYIEASVGEILALSERELADLIAASRRGEFVLRYVNSFVRPDLKICTAPLEELERYALEVIRRVALLGVKVLVFGSGKARECPPEMPLEEGRRRFEEFTALCGKIAQGCGVKIALEPLNRTETNILNSVAEGAQVVRKLNSAAVVLLADAFHMDLEGETAAVILENSDILSHLHISEAPGRVYPGKFGGAYLKTLALELKAAGFQSDVSVECVFDDFINEGPEAFRFVKEIMV